MVIQNPFKKLDSYFEKKRNVDLMLSEKYQEGYLAGIGENSREIKELTKQLSTATYDSISKMNELQTVHKTTINQMESNWLNNCQACKVSINSQKTRLKKLQDEMLNSIEEFSNIFNKLFAFVEMASHSITTIARLTTTKHQLENIKVEADNYLKSKKRLLELNDFDDFELPKEEDKDNDGKSKITEQLEKDNIISEPISEILLHDDIVSEPAK